MTSRRLEHQERNADRDSGQLEGCEPQVLACDYHRDSANMPRPVSVTQGGQKQWEAHSHVEMAPAHTSRSAVSLTQRGSRLKERHERPRKKPPC